MQKNKNFWFPFCARRKEARDEQLIGIESLTILSSMKESSKEEQYLFYYNFKNKKYIKDFCGRKIPYFVKSKERCPQTTFVIDFDNLIPSVSVSIREKFSIFKEALNGKALLLDSPSGNIHVLYVIKGAVPPEDYERIQRIFINYFFREHASFVDRSSSYSLNRGFYHSQHLVRWVEKRIVHPTPASQKKNGFFWDNKFQITFMELMDLIAVCQPIQERKIYELANDAERMLDFMRIIARSGNNEEKKKYSSEINRIMAELRYREAGKCKTRTEKICRRAQEEQYKAAVQCIEGVVGETVFRTSTVQEVCGNLVPRNESERISEHLERDEKDKNKTREVCLSGTGSEVSGHSLGGDSRNDGNQERGYGDDFCDEHILVSLSNFRDSLKSRGFPVEKLGNFFLQNTLRSNSDWNNLPEKSDIGLFFSVLRETLDRDTRLRAVAETSPERLFIWFRYAGRHLRTKGKSFRSLSVFASDAARCLRLCLKTQNYEIKLNGTEISRKISVNNELSIKLLNMIEPHLPKLSEGLSQQNKKTAIKLFKHDRAFLEAGTSALLTKLKEIYPLMKSGKLIAIGMEDFQEFFQTHTRKAVLLRHIFMGFLSGKTKEYIPCIQRRSFLINLNTLDEVFCNEAAIPSSATELAKKLGGGNTWKSICKYLAPMYQAFGLSKTKELWYSAIDLSTANSPEGRKKDIEKYLNKLEKAK